MVIKIKSGKITRFYLIILIYFKGLYIVQKTIYIGFKIKYKLYSLVWLGPSYFLKLDFLLSVIKTFLIMDIKIAATFTVIVLNLIVLFLVIRIVGFTFK